MSASEFVDGLSPRDLRAAVAVLFDWRTWARPEQLEPEGAWRTWLLMTGRGWGKTRTGAEWVRERVESGAKRIGLIGRTSADVRDVMVEGESGLLACFPPHERPMYEPSKRRILFKNGALGTTYTGDEPDLLRGPQHDTLWADEVATWRRPEAWDNALLGLRLGQDPRACVTTTPRPKAVCRILRDLVDDPTTIVTRGATRQNAANLAPAFLAQVVRRYAGTRLGEQELEGVLLEDFPGALWTVEMLAAARTPRPIPTLGRIVVAVDPAASANEDSDETGIVVAGRAEARDPETNEQHGHVLEDRSGRLSPEGWARRAIGAYHDHGADRIVAEKNQGGDMVRHVIRSIDPTVPVILVHATRGKHVRAEPISARYERGLIHHAPGLETLEGQLLGFTFEGFAGDGSPDRADALVWAMHDLFPPAQWGFEHLEQVDDEPRRPRDPGDDDLGPLEDDEELDGWA